MAKLISPAQNVFDLMVPTAQGLPSDDDVLRANVPLVTNFVDLLAGHLAKGELFGLVERFEARHQIDKLQSWISRGPNLPISLIEVQEILGEPFLTELEKRLTQAGYLNAADPKEKLLGNISKVFPAVVRIFARTGQIPPQRILARCVAEFQQSFKS